MKIGLLGGSFNPPHLAHKEMGKRLIDTHTLDKVIYIPAGNNYNKPGLIDINDRINMLKLMLQDLDNIHVSDYEKDKGMSYTYQTLEYFQKLYPKDDIYFICGSDNLKEINTWKEYEKIIKLYHLLVIKRDNDDISKIINEMNLRGNIISFNMNLDDISSTKIRNDIKRGINPLNVDKKVLKYIEKKKLYGGK